MENYKHEMYEENLKKGTEVEMKEHGLPKKMACRIAKDHMRENPNYYSRMKANYRVKKLSNNISKIMGAR